MSGRGMASQGSQFPPQKQDAQPGKEHVMDPTPQATSHDYKPANKLQVRRVWLVPTDIILVIFSIKFYFVAYL